MTEASSTSYRGSRLSAVVTGMEHSGTTFLSKLILANCPTVNSAFECGILLCERGPRNFQKVQPFYDWLCYSIESGHWGLSSEQRDYVCDTDSWESFYERLIDCCPLFSGPKQFILDKTPGYCYELKRVTGRMPAVPFIVIVKDLLLLYRSYKRRGVSLSDFEERYKRFRKSLRDVDPNRVLIVHHKELCQNPLRTIGQIFVLMGKSPPSQLSYDLNWKLIPSLRPDYDYDSDRRLACNELSSKEAEVLNRLDDLHFLRIGR